MAVGIPQQNFATYGAQLAAKPAAHQRLGASEETYAASDAANTAAWEMQEKAAAEHAARLAAGAARPPDVATPRPSSGGGGGGGVPPSLQALGGAGGGVGGGGALGPAPIIEPKPTAPPSMAGMDAAMGGGSPDGVGMVGNMPNSLRMLGRRTYPQDTQALAGAQGGIY